jgi:hypothetical protein
LRDEEIKWYERAKVKTLLEGDANTRFFHLVANGKHRKQHIYRLEDDNGVAVTSDRLLYAFKQLSGLKINFHKSEVLCYGATRELEASYTSLFGCDSGDYPFRYLGIPMHHRQLLNSEWSKVEQRFQQKLLCWKAKYLSYEGRLVLLNLVLSRLLMFMMSFFEVPKGVLKNWIISDLDFFWQGSAIKHKYMLAKWDILCRPKD